MGWIHIDSFSGRCVDPTIGGSAASSDKPVRIGTFDDGQLKIAVKGSGGDRLPRRICHWF
jgi:hypothetical protein